MIPTWLRRHLEQTGRMVDGVTRRAHPSRCRHCGHTVIRGLTDEPCSLTAVVDPTPLSTLGETQALLAGRMTLDLGYHGGRLELEIRDAAHIRGSPASSPDHWRRHSDVVATHTCGHPPLHAIPSRITTPGAPT